MSQVNVSPGGSGYRDDSASAAAGWTAATIAMIVGFVILLAVLFWFLASQAGWFGMGPTIIQQPTERTNTTIIDRQAPAPQAPNTSSSSSGSGTGGTTGSTGGTSGTTGGR